MLKSAFLIGGRKIIYTSQLAFFSDFRSLCVLSCITAIKSNAHFVCKKKIAESRLWQIGWWWFELWRRSRSIFSLFFRKSLHYISQEYINIYRITHCPKKHISFEIAVVCYILVFCVYIDISLFKNLGRMLFFYLLCLYFFHVLGFVHLIFLLMFFYLYMYVYCMIVQI